MDKPQTAIFGGGCFWCTEAIFSRIKRVISVDSGYAGGQLNNPTYEQVSSGSTGYAEVIKIKFDPKFISYDSLLDVFFHTHDPTTLNRQGHDVGEQYRSIIFYTSQNQKKLADNMVNKLTGSGEFNDPIVTQIKKLDKFYPAEDYHQNNKTNNYCSLVIDPKLKEFQKRYQSLLK